ALLAHCPIDHEMRSAHGLFISSHIDNGMNLAGEFLQMCTCRAHSTEGTPANNICECKTNTAYQTRAAAAAPGAPRSDREPIGARWPAEE
ncbi:MAG: hypothetical protein ACM3Y8_01110, partial [Byssovorax cruenta]